ncbi:Transcriptional regulator [Lachnellula hyalina]|uniref:Transcriptional regulator n=1 Tax=Lachnellula hyalina TaxID=1316788 RepID=A0A8H8TYS8_9HELO|nr:Transcriptional regulator [Lachnellula hyalina]TVY27504.1 Transcriptional regulator [Lachnellula hyalina]
MCSSAKKCSEKEVPYYRHIESLVNLLAAAHSATVKSDEVSPAQNSDQSIQSTPSDSHIPPASLYNLEAPIPNRGSWATPTQSQLPVHDVSSMLGGSGCIPNMPSRPAPQPSTGYVPLIYNTIQDEEDLLRVYKEQFAIRFPFIILPPHTTSSELRAQKPFLHRAIMLVASNRKRMQQIEMAKQLSMDIAGALILKGDRSLDMLQSLVTYNAWSYLYSPTVPQAQSTAMFQLSFALIFDLGINRPVASIEGPEGLVDPSRNVVEINPKEAKRTLDERRAYISCYILTSVVALYVKKTDGLQYSPYMDYNCRVLEETAACESDLLLVAMARLQTMAESFYKNILNKTQDSIKTPAWMYTRTMRTGLHSLWMSFSPQLRQNPFLIMNYHSTEIFLFEPALQQSPVAVGFVKDEPHRLDMLHSCLTSSKALLDLFLTQPLSVYYTLTSIDLANLGQSMATIFKLSMVDEPGWDLTYVRKTINPRDYFDRMINNFEHVGRIIDQSQPEPCRHSFPTGCANAMKKIRGVYEARMAAETAQDTSQEQTNSLALDGLLNGDQMIDWMDDAYWQDLLNDGNFMQ